MTLAGGQSAALAVALVAPAAGALAVATRRTSAEVRAVQASAAASAVAWVVLVGTAARGRAGIFHVSPLVAVGGCGAALLAAAALDGGRRDHRAVVGTALALAAFSAGLAGGGRPGQVVVAGGVLGGLALAAAAAVDAMPPAERWFVIPFAGVGLGAAGVGFVLLQAGGDRWSLPSTGTVPRGAIIAFALAGAALSVAGTSKGRRPTGVLLAGGLVLGLAASPLRPGNGDLAAVSITLGVLALAAAATGRGPTSLALLALAAGAGPPAFVPASRLLAAGSVVAAAVDRPAAWLAAVPGGVALAAGVVDAGGPLAACVAVAATLVAAALAAWANLARGAKEPEQVATEPSSPAHRRAWAAPGVIPAVIAGAWLSLAPGSWTWTGATLRSYDRGMALAVAAGLVTVAAAVLPFRPRLLPRSGSSPPPDRLQRAVRRPPAEPQAPLGVRRERWQAGRRWPRPLPGRARRRRPPWSGRRPGRPRRRT